MMLKNLGSLSILLGMKCNCKCPHCFYFPRNDNHMPIDLDMLDDALKSIEGQHSIYSVNFAGGEPFYYYDVMLECIERLKRHGIYLFSLSTNGGWASSVELAREKLTELLSLGLGAMYVSADGFHQMNIPLKNVINIIRAGDIARASGENFNVCVMSSYLGYYTYDCEINRLTSNIRQTIWEAGLYPVETFVNAHGRAAYIMPPELQVNKRLDRKCWEIKIGILNPAGPSMVSIDPTGFVDGCFGVPLGNLHKESLNDIFQRYFNNPGPIVKTLREKGALGLKELAVERGFVAAESYFDECHLCHMARNYLKEHCSDEFGEFLNPAACYPPILDNKAHPFEDWSLAQLEK